MKNNALFNIYLDTGGRVYLGVLSFLSTVFSLVMPVAILTIFDRVVPNNAQNTLVMIFVIVVAVCILDFFVKKAEEKYVSSLSRFFEEHIIQRLYQAFSYANIRKFFMYGKGEYFERLNTVNLIINYISLTIRMKVAFVGGAIFLLLIGLIDIGSGITLAVATLSLFLAARYISNQKVKQLESKSDSEGSTQSRIVEIVSNPLHLKSFAMEYRMENMMRELVKTREEHNSRYECLTTYYSVILALVQQLSVVCVVMNCSLSVMNMSMSQGVMAAVIMLTNRYFGFCQQVMNFVNSHKENTLYVERLEDIIDLKEDIPDAPAIDEMGSITCGKQQQYRFTKGNIVVLSGGSFSGKTYFTKLLTKEIKDEKVPIIIDDMPLQKLEHVSIVNMHSQFIEGTIIDNITCFKPELYHVAYSLCEAMGIRNHIDQLRLGFYTELKSNNHFPFSRQVRFSLFIIRALLSHKTLIVIDDIDRVYDRQFEEHLINCISPRIASICCVIVSNKMTSDDANILPVSISEIMEDV